MSKLMNDRELCAVTDNHHDNEQCIPVSFRWPIKQVGDSQVIVMIPTGDMPILNPSFVDAYQLTDKQLEACEDQVLRQVMILPEA